MYIVLDVYGCFTTSEQFCLGKEMKWSEANDTCANNGQLLVSLETKNKGEILTSWMEKNYPSIVKVWIGLSKRRGQLTWESGSKYTSENKLDINDCSDYPGNYYYAKKTVNSIRCTKNSIATFNFICENMYYSLVTNSYIPNSRNVVITLFVILFLLYIFVLIILLAFFCKRLKEKKTYGASPTMEYHADVSIEE